MRNLTLHLSFFLLGAFTIIVQTLLTREFLVVFYGSEMCMGVIFAAWFLGITAGGIAGGRLASRAKAPRAWFCASLAVMAALAIAAILAARILRRFLHVPEGQFVPFGGLALSSLLAVSPLTFLTGFAFPNAVRAVEPAAGPDRSVGRVFFLEAAGSLCGGLFATFVLIPLSSPLPALWLVATVFAALAATAAVPFSGPAGRGRFQAASFAVCLLTAAFLAVLLLSGAASRLDRWSSAERFKEFNIPMDLVEEKSTPYQHLSLGRTGEQFNLFGNGVLAASFPDDYTFSRKAMLYLSEHPDPKSVLLVGGGSPCLVRHLLKGGAGRVDYVELDPAVMDMMKSRLPPEDLAALSDPRVRISFNDGRSFVSSETVEKYDLVISETPDPSTAMLNRFYTLEYFKAVQRILNPGGVLALRLSSNPDYMGRAMRELDSSVYLTLDSVFRNIAIVPAEDMSIFASDADGAVSSSPETLASRMSARPDAGGNDRAAYRAMFASMISVERVDKIGTLLSEAPGVLLNTDERPVSYFYSLRLWSLLTSERKGSGFTGILDLAKPGIATALSASAILLLLLRVIFSRIMAPGKDRRRRFNALAGATAAGFAGISFNLLLMYSFQNTFGCLYEEIGLLVGVFMAGLAAGGLTANRMISTGKGRSAARLLMAQLLVALLAIGLIPWLKVLPLLHSFSEFIFLTAGAGLATGIIFPLSAHLYREAGGSQAAAAGLVESADHGGAMSGALLTGVVLVPLAGHAGVLVLVAVLNVGAAILTLLDI